MSLVPENIQNQDDDKNTIIANITPRSFMQSEHKINIDIVPKMDTVGLTYEKYNFSFLNVTFHTVFITPLLYPITISL
jgi:hypothetical protein